MSDPPTCITCEDLERLTKTVEDIYARPFTPSNLQKALLISSKERISWTRQGKLIIESKFPIKNSGHFSLPLYNSEDVNRLLEQPDIIQRWRNENSPLTQ